MQGKQVLLHVYIVTNHCDRRITPSDTDTSLLCSIYAYFTPYFDVAFYSNTPIAKEI
jgi:hypothetical protein